MAFNHNNKERHDRSIESSNIQSAQSIRNDSTGESRGDAIKMAQRLYEAECALRGKGKTPQRQCGPDFRIKVVTV